ncbi:acyl-CoA dehydrogenase [Kitasatospora purpeofusca]|uniref:acyl-CoA dehydrogenase n=1 Tax=Kitasatospora purpeofusca TaxID=67352 RepID=UPI00224EE74C|nr:acyl-CoA dehydrogenase [Kitasatospora purpeofusca]MCX4754376.1 acyl-CoA dehydrogenase [Kitasatospora purpeofusca]WSR33801.1 acyl-CoA dehydrogenase [Kitasatospora purpeofusca]
MSTATTTPALYAALDTPAPLEALLGDPDYRDNPLGFDAFLAADERGDLLQAGERALDAYGLGAEFVPRRLGGRLDRADRLARVLRPLFRRDGALALGHGASNLVGSVNVWSEGSAQQQDWLAGVLLGNGRIAAAYTDLSTGNDVTRTAFRAEVRRDELVLNGRKEIINNLARAEAVTVLARTSEEPGSRSHSMVLVDMAAAPRDRLRFLPRYRTSGVRSMYLGGLEFRDCPLPVTSIAGGTGEAMETILRAFQITRAVLPAAALGAVDQQLRTVTDFALGRRLYHRAVADLPHARSVLTGAFLDLLVADCFTTTVCRALHVLPERTSVYAASVKHLVPTLYRESVDRLAVLLGARSFLREGPYGIFQKHARDLPVASLVHAGGTVCQATVIPQLPRLARQSWLTDGPAPAALFHLAGDLPELDLGRLGVTAGREDPLIGTLVDAAARLAAEPVLGPLCAQLLDELRALRQSCLELAPRDRTPLADPVSFRLAERYGVLLAAASCLGVWLHNPDHPGSFLRGTGWLAAALARLTARLGCPPVPGADAAHPEVFAELIERHQDGRGFDLVGRQLA